MNFNWYKNRLKAMPLAEIVYRIRQTCSSKRLNKQIQEIAFPEKLSDIINGANCTIGSLPIDFESIAIDDQFYSDLIDQANKICLHQINLFDCEFDLGEKIDWFHDYSKHRSCAKVAYNKINYRRPEDTGDIMYIWWLNRHQHLVTLACAYYISGNTKYSDEILSQLESWLIESSFPIGPGWLTGIEVSIRLLCWSWVYRFIFSRSRPENFADPFMATWLHSIKQHIKYLEVFKAKYSSANNHSIAEKVGLIAAASTWPALFEKEDALSSFCQELLEEVDSQISKSGLHLELSTSYHAFVLELLVNAATLCPTIRKPLRPTLSAMSDFLAAILGDNYQAPDFSDADYATATGLIPRSANFYTKIATVAKTISNLEVAQDLTSLSNLEEFYTGLKKAKIATSPSLNLSEAGYVIWNTDLNQGQRLKLCVNTSNLGFGTLAAHGHADALSFTLDLDQQPIFIDPGSYAYHDQPQWRNYFRGTSAHNTLAINDQNQADIKGPFLWGKHYHTKVKHVVMSHDQFDLKASHNGYRKDKVIHTRTFSFHPSIQSLDILDCLTVAEEIPAKIFFHLHPDLNVTQIETNKLEIFGNKISLKLTFDPKLNINIVKGQEKPILGWVSPTLGKKVSTNTIVLSGIINNNDKLVTTIFFDAK